MAGLTSATIAASYDQLLIVDRDGGGNTTTHVAVKDGDGDTTFPITLATDAIMITSTNRLEFGDDASYIHQSADGVLDLVSDTEIELTATAIDINGTVDMSSTLVVNSTTTIKKALSSDIQTIPETILTLGSTYSSTGSDGGVGSGSRIEFQIPDDDTNPITGSAIAGLKENADDGISSSALAFYTSQDDTTLDEAMRISSDGKVGIGTAAPSEVLTIAHAAADGDGGILIINEATTIADDTFLGGIGFDSADGNIPSSVGEAGAAMVARSAVAHSTTAKGADLLFLTTAIADADDTGSHERMRITSEGNIGIGVDSPVTALDIHSTGTEVAAAFGMADDGNVWVTTRVGEVEDRAGVYAFMVGSAAIDGVSSSNCTAYIQSQVNNDGGSLQGDLQFYTNAGDSLGSAKVKIYNGGEIDMSFHGDTSSGGTAALINSAGRMGTTTSLRELKGNIKKIDIDATALMNKFEPVTFNYKKYDTTTHKYLDELEDGFEAGMIVDDVQDFASDFNQTDKDGKVIGIRYHLLVPYLIKAVQELTSKVEALENS